MTLVGVFSNSVLACSLFKLLDLETANPSLVLRFDSPSFFLKSRRTSFSCFLSPPPTPPSLQSKLFESLRLGPLLREFDDELISWLRS